MRWRFKGHKPPPAIPLVSITLDSAKHNSIGCGSFLGMKRSSIFRFHGDFEARINDIDFCATLVAHDDLSKGELIGEMTFSKIPQGWHPLAQTQASISFSNALFALEEGGARNLLSLAGGNFRAERSLKFDDGNIVHVTADVHRAGDTDIRGRFTLNGTAAVPSDLVSVGPYEEVMKPRGPGIIVGEYTAEAMRKSGGAFLFKVNTIYSFDSRAELQGSQLRRVEGEASVTDLNLHFNYRATVKPIR